MTPDEEDHKGMDDAVERARERGGADTFGAVAALDDDDKQPDYASPTPEADKPSAPASPPDVAPSPPLKSFTEPPRAAPPAQSPAYDFASALRGITSRRYTPSAAVSDEAISKAKASQRAQTQANDMTRAIQGFLMRKPYAPGAPEDTASELEQRRAKEESEFDKNQQRDLSASALMAKALKGEKPPALTPYQKLELEQRDRAIKAKSDERAAALADRKRTMLSLYPEHKAEINALGDLGDAQTLQTALEGRMAREGTQSHADEAAAKAEADRQRDAATNSQRELAKEIALKKWEQEHQNLTAEQKTQLEAINAAPKVLDTFEASLGDVSDTSGKLASAVPGVAGALGLHGASFPASRHAAATELARAIEGGTAKPGTIQVIESFMPNASDDDATKAQKMKQVRQYVKDKSEAFMQTAQQSGAQVRPVASGKVLVRKGSETLRIDASDLKDAEADGYVRVSK